MGGRLVRVRDGDLKPITDLVAVAEADKAIEHIRSSIGKPGDEIISVGPVSHELLKTLVLEAGHFKRLREPTISQQQQQRQPQSAA